MVIGVVLTLRHHRSRAARGSPLCPGDLAKGTHALEAPVTIEAVTDLSRTQAGEHSHVLHLLVLELPVILPHLYSYKCEIETDIVLFTNLSLQYIYLNF